MAKSTKYDAESFWNKRYELFDITTSGHIDLPLEFNRWMYKLKLKKVRQAAERHIGKSKISEASVVDLGCGTGVYVEQWQALKVSKLVGVDISSKAVKNLQKKHPKYQFYCESITSSTASEIPQQGSYDIVTAIGVLVHVINDQEFKAALKNIAKLVKSDGVILLAEYLCRNEAQEFSYMKIRNIAWYTDALAEAGLELIEQRPLYFFMGRPYDTPSDPMRFILPPIFNFTRRLAHRFPKLTGGVLYFTDLIITAILTDGPSEELLACRKK